MNQFAGGGRITQLFNRSLFDRSDPAENIGVYLSPFSLYQVYSEVDTSKLGVVRQEVYSRILQRLASSAPPHVQTELVQYADAKHQAAEGPRDYVVVKRETPRATQATILARCLAYGDNLYLSVDSYALGSLDRGALTRRVLLSLIPLLLFICPLLGTLPSLLSAMVASPFGGRGVTLGSAVRGSLGSLICCAIPILAILVFLWLDVIRGFSQHKNIGLALRQAFSRIPNDATFNLDDMFMFFKSVLPTIIYSVRDVFKDHDIPIKTLDDFIAQVNNINNINNYASNMGAQGTFNSQVRMNQPEKRQAG